jgi:two-component system CheB/CheR fusion protein
MAPLTGRAQSQTAPTFVVGIGASAGGLEALEHFFDNMPTDSGMAFVVVQHLSPDFKSLMDEILARRTKLPIQLVEDGIEVHANHVYLIPPKKEMIIAEGRLLLGEKVRDQELSLPIDLFFRSLAQDCGRRAVAIVLSGGGSDGSRGIRAVHEAGGLVLVQDVESAQFDGMPKTARDAGVADKLLPPHEMPRVLMEHARGFVGQTPGKDTESSEQGMGAVYRMLEQEFGIDFTHYKPSTVTRRIERRLQLARAEDIGEYVQRLKADRAELDVLYRDLLIGVTTFFRNQEAFQILEERVLPELLGRLPANAPLRAWVIGCATGEEVYSLAILLHELMHRLGERPVKIFATDVHRGSIEVATRALYAEEALVNMKPERLERYFMPRGRAYQVVPDIRQMVVFANHNVIRDAPFTHVDLISCRNMLIYLQPNVQRKVLNLFTFALNRGGVMFLGPSESPGAVIDNFQALDKHWRIYRKHTERHPHFEPGTQARPKLPTATTQFNAAFQPSGQRASSVQLLTVYDSLLAQFMPPSLLVSDTGELIQAFGGASRFLRMRDGRQGLDVLELVTPQLKVGLMGGFSRAAKLDAPMVLRDVRASDDPNEPPYKVTLRRLQTRNGAPAHVLISFEPLEHKGPEVGSGTELDMSEMSREHMRALEAELSYTKENLQAATEELESSNEELQAANEELLASNEELQSTNEELQSVNEELYSVNAEYQRKISDLTELGNDMENLFASTDIATMFLDRQMRIRKFTAQVAESFNLMPQDVGRRLDTFSNTIDHPRLMEDLSRVLETGVPVECEAKDGQGRPCFLRILPYRAKGRIDGVVLTLIDVSAFKRAEDALFHERHLLNSLLCSVPDAIYFKDARGAFIRVNEAMAARLGVSSPRDAVGKTSYEILGTETALRKQQQDEQVVRSGMAQHYQLEPRVLPNGEQGWDLATRLPLHDPRGELVGMIGVNRDVSEQKRSDELVQQAVRRRDEFLAMLSHELRNPLGAIVAATALLKDEPKGNAKHQKRLEILERQSQQMARLLDDLLEVSRVTQDKIELRREVIDLREVIRDAADVVRGLMQTRELSFTMELGDVPLYVDGDAARLQQIHVNLLRNAAKYTPRGRSVSLEAHTDGNQICVLVRDDGAGIPAHLLEGIFELFVQASRTLDRSEGGLGVGLTLVRALVRKHGGTVSARSEGEGKGSEFEVRLPSAAAPATRPTPPVIKATRMPGELRVLVVEDNADSRVMLCELLSMAGFACETADSSTKALNMLETLQPDVGVIDIGLPDINGLELARRIRKNPATAGLYLIAVTGYGQREDRLETHKAGFDLHLVKPIDPSKLIELLGDKRNELMAVRRPPEKEQEGMPN